MQNYQAIEVDDKFVILDLGDKDGQLSLILLYKHDISIEGKADLKLVSYHVSY